MQLRLQIIYLIVLILLSAFFAASEIAILTTSRFKVMQLYEKNKRGSSALKKLKDNPHYTLATILIANNFVNVAASSLATSISLTIFHNYGIGIATGVMTFLLLFFGDLTPKSVASQHADKFALLVSKPIWILSLILSPITKVFDWLMKYYNKIFGIKKADITQEEVMGMVKYAEQQGTIKEIKKKLIQNVFELDNVVVRDIMTPKEKMIVISLNSKIKDLVRLYFKNPFSRIPVYENTQDKILGVVFIKDCVKYAKENKLDAPIQKIMRKPFFVSEYMKIDFLLKHLQLRKEHIAIVNNEQGLVVGIVTLEDVIEEIVGEMTEQENIV